MTDLMACGNTPEGRDEEWQKIREHLMNPTQHDKTMRQMRISQQSRLRMSPQREATAHVQALDRQNQHS